jgi:hypothetical protein
MASINIPKHNYACIMQLALHQYCQSAGDDYDRLAVQEDLKGNHARASWMRHLRDQVKMCLDEMFEEIEQAKRVLEKELDDCDECY